MAKKISTWENHGQKATQKIGIGEPNVDQPDGGNGTLVLKKKPRARRGISRKATEVKIAAKEREQAYGHKARQPRVWKP
jgi:hypothetical protein